MNAVTCQASGVRASTDRRPPARRRSPRPDRLGRLGLGHARARPGPARCVPELGQPDARRRSARAAPTCPAEADRPGPARRLVHRHRDQRGDDGPGRQAIRYRPISSPARSGRRRLTRLGSSTFISAMAVPGEHRAGQQQRRRRGAAQHQAGRQQDQGRAEHPLLAEPRLSGAATPENTPKHSTGMAASTDWLAADRCSAPCSSGKIGGRLVMAARMLMARTMIPAVSSAVPVPRTADARPSPPLSAAHP